MLLKKKPLQLVCSNAFIQLILLTRQIDSRTSPQVMTPTLDDSDLTKQEELSTILLQSTGETGEEQVSAANYDTSPDWKEDEEKRVRAVVAKDLEHEEEELTDVEEEDLDDMFALDVTEKKKKKKVKKASVGCNIINIR